MVDVISEVAMMPRDVLKVQKFYSDLSSSESYIMMFMMLLEGGDLKCTCSKKTIQEYTRLSRGTVNDAIERLIEKKIIIKIVSKDEKGSHIPNEYSLNINLPLGSKLTLPWGQNWEEGRAKIDPTPRVKIDPTLGTDLTPPLGSKLTPLIVNNIFSSSLKKINKKRFSENPSLLDEILEPKRELELMHGYDLSEMTEEVVANMKPVYKDDVDELINYSGEKFDNQKQKKSIRQLCVLRLSTEEFSVDDLKLAIDGNRLEPWFIENSYIGIRYALQGEGTKGGLHKVRSFIASAKIYKKTGKLPSEKNGNRAEDRYDGYGKRAAEREKKYSELEPEHFDENFEKYWTEE